VLNISTIAHDIFILPIFPTNSPTLIAFTLSLLSRRDILGLLANIASKIEHASVLSIAILIRAPRTRL
jgi:hypothetical protein